MPKAHTSMGRQSKAKKGSTCNFGKLNNAQNPSVEDASDDEDLDFEDDDLLEDRFFFLDDESSYLSSYQLCKPCGSFHQCLQSRPDRSGSSLGKSQVSWASHTATRYSFEAKNGT